MTFRWVNKRIDGLGYSPGSSTYVHILLEHTSPLILSSFHNLAHDFGRGIGRQVHLCCRRAALDATSTWMRCRKKLPPGFQMNPLPL